MSEYTILFILTSFVFIWLFFLTLVFFSLRRHFNQLSGKNRSHNLEDILNNILTAQKRLTIQQGKMGANFDKLETKTNLAIQKIGYLRFNPFDETGGDQSFAISLLDNHKNGMVFTFLHSRERTRVYGKRIKNAKPENFPLSKEEEYVIASAS